MLSSHRTTMSDELRKLRQQPSLESASNGIEVCCGETGRPSGVLDGRVLDSRALDSAAWRRVATKTLVGGSLISLIMVWGHAQLPLHGVLPLVPVLFILAMAVRSGQGVPAMHAAARETVATLPGYFACVLVFVLGAELAVEGGFMLITAASLIAWGAVTRACLMLAVKDEVSN